MIISRKFIMAITVMELGQFVYQDSMSQMLIVKELLWRSATKKAE